MKEENMKKQAVKEPDVDGQVSEWNEALFKMKRLHELQTEINKSGLCTACGLVLASKKRTRKLKKLREKKE